MARWTSTISRGTDHGPAALDRLWACDLARPGFSVEVPRTISESLESGSISIPPPIEAVKTWPLIGEPLFSILGTRIKQSQGGACHSRSLSEASRQHLARRRGERWCRDSSIRCFSDHSGISVFAWSFAGRGCLPRFCIGVFRAAATNSCNWRARQSETCRKGVIGVSLLQALLAGVGLIAVGAPGASLIAFFVLVLGIVQIGPTVILLPVIIWSWITMETSTALIFTAYMVAGEFCR